MPSDTDKMNWLKTLHPGYFAMTMATGIIAIALDVLGNPVFSDVLYGSTVASWCILLILYTWRVIRFPAATWADLTNPRLTFNYFTIVAATDVLGLVLYIHEHVVAAVACWWIALITWATWWIPLLVVIGIWKHGVHKIRLGYDPRQWSIVFPLGMYTVATYQVSLAAEFDAMHRISHVTVWIAILAWFLLFFALGHRITVGLLGKNRTA